MEKYALFVYDDIVNFIDYNMHSIMLSLAVHYIIDRIVLCAFYIYIYIVLWCT